VASASTRTGLLERAAGISAVNKTGKTQLHFTFDLDGDNDGTAG
jgi:hypothetical protein